MAHEQRGRQAPRPALLVIARARHVLKRPTALSRACARSRADSAPADPSNPISSADNQPPWPAPACLAVLLLSVRCRLQRILHFTGQRQMLKGKGMRSTDAQRLAWSESAWRAHAEQRKSGRAGTRGQTYCAPTTRRWRAPGSEAETSTSGVKGNARASGAASSHTRVRCDTHSGRSGLRSAAASAGTSAPTCSGIRD